MFSRMLQSARLARRSCFLWGPRQVGKSTLSRHLFPDAPYYNLLDAAFCSASFEHFILMELRAHCAYSLRPYPPLSYWRTSSGLEVDVILGDGRIAIEVQSSDRPTT